MLNEEKAAASITILEDLPNASLLVSACPISLHIREHTALVGPVVIF